MRNFVEFVAAETGRKMAIPVDVVRGISGANGKPTLIFPARTDHEGNPTIFPDTDLDAGIFAKDSYEDIMKQLKFFRQFDRK